MHIGNRIKEILKTQRISVTKFAMLICCTRTHVYKILDKDSINTDLLKRISQELNHDFFYDLSQDLKIGK